MGIIQDMAARLRQAWRLPGRSRAKGAGIGLALSGGGARGLAHIGVLKVLEETRFPISALSGTSMGGIVAGLYASGRSADALAEFAHTVRLLDIVQREESGLGLIGQKKLTAKLYDMLGGDLTFADLRLPLALVAADMDTGEEIVIRDGPVIPAMLATSAFPGVFPPVAWRERRLVDGGLLNQVPVDVLPGMGMGRIVAVNTRGSAPEMLTAPSIVPAGRPETIVRLLFRSGRWAPLLHITDRSLTIMSDKLVEYRLEKTPPDLMVEVWMDGIGLFELDRVADCIRAGELAALEHLSELIAMRDVAQ